METEPATKSNPLTLRFMALAALLAAVGWSYWPMLVTLEGVWRKEADYSHGYLVAPIALYFLWDRRRILSTIELSTSMWGFVPLAFAMVIRHYGNVYYIDPVEQLAFLITVGSVVWIVGGGAFVRWASPAIAFLVFLFPMPYSVGRAFSLQLQKIATLASCWILQLIGLPAYNLGNIIDIKDQQIEVAQACSGLRMLMGFVAVSAAYVVLTDRSLWEKAFILLAALPIAIFCNVIRITVTGLLYYAGNTDWAKAVAHDGAGLAMMPFALGILFLCLVYLDHLFVEVDASGRLSASRAAR